MKKSTEVKISFTIILSCIVLSVVGINSLIKKTQIKGKEFLKDEVSRTMIKEADILEVKKNGYSSDPFIILDTNKNGKSDKADDFVPVEHRFQYDEDGKTMVFLDDPEKKLGHAKPLAYSNKNGEYIVIKMPSDYFETIQSYTKSDEAYKLDKAFGDYMKNKEIVDSVRFKER